MPKLCPLNKFSGRAQDDAKAQLAKFETHSSIDKLTNGTKCLVLSTYLDAFGWELYQGLDAAIKTD